MTLPPSSSSVEFVELDSSLEAYATPSVLPDVPTWSAKASTDAFVAAAGAEAAVNVAAEQARSADSASKLTDGHAAEHAAISNFAANAASRAFESAKDFANVAQMASAAALRAANAKAQDRRELSAMVGGNQVNIVATTAVAPKAPRSSRRAGRRGAWRRRSVQTRVDMCKSDHDWFKLHLLTFFIRPSIVYCRFAVHLLSVALHFASRERLAW